MNKEVTVQVGEATYGLGQGLRKFVADVKQALADGWQPGQDLPVVLNAVFLDLIPQIQNVSKVALEPTVDAKSFTRALSLSAEDMAFDFLVKK